MDWLKSSLKSWRGFAESPIGRLAGAVGLAIGVRPSDLVGLEAEPYIKLLFDAMVIGEQRERLSLADEIRRRYRRWTSWRSRLSA